MKRHIPGLHQQTQNHEELPEGLFLVRVDQVAYRFHPQKPFFTLRFGVLEPEVFAGRTFSGRLYCTPRALWKLSWFLQDFGYEADLVNHDEVDEKKLMNLRGVVRLSRTRLNGHCFLNLEGFAPAGEWEELSTAAATAEGNSENLDDL